MTVRVTAVSAGAVEYLLRGAGCAEHGHDHEVSESRQQRRARERAESKAATRPGPNGGRQVDHTGAAYLLNSAQHEAAGIWFGQGLDMVGMTAGDTANPKDVRAVFGRLEHPTRVHEKDDPRRGVKKGDPVALGSRPRKFKTADERIATAVAAAGPDATPEQIEELRNQALGDGRKAVAYYDVTFSPVKSVSVLYTALLVGGREADAAAVAAAHHEAVRAAMEWAEREVAYTRAGYHGKAADGRSVGEYQQAVGLVMTAWQHSTSRAQEPQLHTHVAVLNRVVSLVDGKIRALDGRGFKPVKMGMDAIYRATYERLISERIGVVFALRPDGKAREIMGIDQRLLQAASSRSPQVMTKAEKLFATYRDMHGREPGPRARRNLVQQAARESRARKSHRPPFELLRAWAADKRVALGESLEVALGMPARIATQGHPDQRGYTQRSREEVLAAAVAATQATYSSWDIGNLIAAVEAEVERTPSITGTGPQLAYEILRDAARYGVVLVRGQEIAPVPQAIQRADGRSKFRAHIDETYTTRDQLELEKGVAARAGQLGALRLAGPALELARVELHAAGLGDDQADVVLGILGSGRAGDVLIGPAGAGKSHTVAALARTWEAHFGGRVIGLATSQAATLQLAGAMQGRAQDGRNDDGLLALNTSQFLQRFAPDADGLVRDRVRPGDLFILDEVGMSSTRELDAISRIVAAGGGKLVYTGDDRQLVSIEAGGMLGLLVTDNGAHELTEIHRFGQEWEGQASVRLRNGDAAVLGVYDQHGRLRGGTAEEMSAAVQRAWLADTLEGKESLLVVPSNEAASAMSRALREELVRLGRVSPEVLGTLRDGNLVAVGDLVQARRNDWTIQVAGEGMVVNRLTYRVLGRNEDGSLRVRSPSGLVAHLPREYVEQHLTLAYASTVHAAQGRTVDTCHGLIDERMRRNACYVTLTRGRDGNWAYVVCVQVPDHHEPERIESSPRAMLAGVLSRVDEGVAAEAGRRLGADAAASLTQIGTEWDLLTAEYGRDRYTDVLAALLPDGWMDRVVAEQGYGRLMHAAREAELAGHDPAVLLRDAVAGRSLVGADSVSDVVRWRLRYFQTQRVPDRETPTGDWTALVAPLYGPVGEYAHVLATAASARQAELGELAARQRPAWAVEHLGEPPVEEGARGEWVRRAGVAAAYRELRSIPEDCVSLGAAPAREMVFHRVLWQHAYAALGGPADALDFATATEHELRDMRERLRREENFAPHWVAHELRDARQAAEGYDRDAVLWQAEARRLPAGSPERTQAEADVAAARHLAGLYDARAEHLVAVHAGREQWLGGVEPVRVRSEFAGDELERRGLPRDSVTAAGDQVELFTIAEHGDAARSELGLDRGAAAEPARAGRGEPRDQRERAPEDAYAPGYELRGDAASSDLARRQVVSDGQQQLFTAEPATADLAAAQLLRPRADDASAASRPARQEDAGVTVGQARRQAEVSARLRAERDARTRAAHDRVRSWQSRRAAMGEQTERDRARRDQAERDTRSLDRGQRHDVEPTARGLGRGR